MLCLVCLLIGLATGTAFRVVLLLPVMAVIGTAILLHAVTSHVPGGDAGIDFLTCVVALNLGYVATVMIPLARGQRG